MELHEWRTHCTLRWILCCLWRHREHRAGPMNSRQGRFHSVERTFRFWWFEQLGIKLSAPGTHGPRNIMMMILNFVGLRRSKLLSVKSTQKIEIFNEIVKTTKFIRGNVYCSNFQIALTMAVVNKWRNIIFRNIFWIYFCIDNWN
jgi:hypothetical protein